MAIGFRPRNRPTGKTHSNQDHIEVPTITTGSKSNDHPLWSEDCRTHQMGRWFYIWTGGGAKSLPSVGVPSIMIASRQGKRNKREGRRRRGGGTTARGNTILEGCLDHQKHEWHGLSPSCVLQGTSERRTLVERSERSRCGRNLQ